MALAGQVKVALSPQQCAAAARWLANYRPPPPSLIGKPACQQAARVMANHLAGQFAKCGRRKARRNSERILSREHARWFGALLDASIVRAHISSSYLPPRLVMEAMQACRKACSGRRGRPRIERTEAELATRHFSDDNGHYRRKLERRANYNRRWAEWTARLMARGETLITSSEPPPQI